MNPEPGIQAERALIRSSLNTSSLRPCTTEYESGSGVNSLSSVLTIEYSWKRAFSDAGPAIPALIMTGSSSDARTALEIRNREPEWSCSIFRNSSII
jgi:hypothetical protein